MDPVLAHAFCIKPITFCTWSLHIMFAAIGWASTWMRGSRIVFGSLICRWLRPPPFFFKFLCNLGLTCKPAKGNSEWCPTFNSSTCTSLTKSPGLRKTNWGFLSMIPFSTRWVEAISKCSCPICTTVMKFFTRYWVDDEALGCFDTLIPKMHNPVPFKKDEVYCHCALLLNLELSATNPLGCKFWGEPPRWVSVEKQDARTLHMISSCFADLSKILCRLFSQFLLCSRILSPSLTPAGFSCTVFCCQVEVVRTLVKFKPSISLYVGVCSAADSSYTVVPHDQF